MSKLLNYIKNLFKTELESLPLGLSEFHAWADSIIAEVGKIADEDSMKFALANMILHLGPAKNSEFQTPPSSVPRSHFVQALKKAAANQVASQVFQDIKEKQEQRNKAVEVTTAAPEAVSGEAKTIN